MHLDMVFHATRNVFLIELDMVSMQIDMVLYAMTHDPYVTRHGFCEISHGSYATKYNFYVPGHSFDSHGSYASRSAFLFT